MSTETQKASKARNWVFTLNNPTPEDEARIAKPYEWVKYVAYSHEVGEEEGTPHLQGYLCTWDPVRMTQIKNYLPRAHLEVMHGRLSDNETYCTKQNELIEIGERPQQGRRSDLIGFKRKIDLGENPLDIAEEEPHFGTYVKYHAGLEKYAHHKQYKRVKGDHSEPDVYIRYGEPGSGKTRWAYEHDSNLYAVPDLTGKWFGSYNGQSTVLFDDVENGQVPSLAFFKNLTDRYPREVPVKGGFTVWKPHTIIFTSNNEPRTWWKDLQPHDYDAVMRRVTRVTRVFKEREEVVYQKHAEA